MATTRVVAGIGFDIDHTLLVDNKLERVAFLHLLDEVVRRGGEPLGSLADESDRIDELLAQQRGGLFTIDEAVRRFFAERGARADDAAIARYKAMALSMVEAFVIPLPDSRKMLRELRDCGYAIAVLTNGWSPLQQRKVGVLGFGGPTIVSGDIGVQKPDVAAFDILVSTLGAPREACWYVGDDPKSDIAGALAARLQAVWLDAEGVAYPARAAAPTLTVHHLGELVAALQGALAAP